MGAGWTGGWGWERTHSGEILAWVAQKLAWDRTLQGKERLWELTLRPGGAGVDTGCHAVGKVTATRHSAPWRK